MAKAFSRYPNLTVSRFRLTLIQLAAMSLKNPYRLRNGDPTTTICLTEWAIWQCSHLERRSINLLRTLKTLIIKNTVISRQLGCTGSFTLTHSLRLRSPQATPAYWRRPTTFTQTTKSKKSQRTISKEYSCMLVERLGKRCSWLFTIASKRDTIKCTFTEIWVCTLINPEALIPYHISQSIKRVRKQRG